MARDGQWPLSLKVSYRLIPDKIHSHGWGILVEMVKPMVMCLTLAPTRTSRMFFCDKTPISRRRKLSWVRWGRSREGGKWHILSWVCWASRRGKSKLWSCGNPQCLLGQMWDILAATWDLIRPHAPDNKGLQIGRIQLLIPKWWDLCRANNRLDHYSPGKTHSNESVTSSS